jgi:hypothetical protein
MPNVEVPETTGVAQHRHHLPISYRFALRAAGTGGRKRGKLVVRRKGSNRHHPVAWKGGKSV